jgi:thiamine-monophosphate kinase
MIDVSDGLSSDLGHLCDESGVGVQIREERVPLSRELRSAKGLRGSPFSYALSGGEDYELLFTVRPENVKKLLSLRIPVAEIGRITKAKERALILRGGTKAPLVPSGYDHFKGASAVRKRTKR